MNNADIKIRLAKSYLDFLNSLKNQINSLLKTMKSDFEKLYLSDISDSLKITRIISRKKEFIEIARRLTYLYSEKHIEINKLISYSVLSTPPYFIEKGDFDVNYDYSKWQAILYELIPRIDQAIGALETIISSLSPEEILNLKLLNQEVEEILKDLPDKLAYEFEKNLKEAIKEIEKGHFLGSALISSRLIVYILDQFPGENFKEKINSLREKGLIQEKGEISQEYVMKADKKARNYFSHNIKAFPDSSESLEILAISVRMLKLFKEYISKQNFKN